MDLSPLSGVRYGSFTSNGVSQLLNLGFIPSFYEAWNITQAASAANPGVQKRVTWYNGMAADSALVMRNTNGAATDQSSIITTLGITAYDGTVAQTFAPVAVTSVSKAANALVTTAAPHGLVVGDSVRLYGVVGVAAAGSAAMADLNGLVFTVLTTPLATTYTISVDTSAFNVAGAGGFSQKVFPSAYWQPKRATVVGISKASPGVVTVAENSLFVNGDIVRLYIPAQYGMQQLNGVLAEVGAVAGTALSLYVPNSGQTIPINTTAYSTFAFPAAVNPPLQYAQVVPVGEDTLPGPVDPKRNTAFQGLQLGSGVVGASSDVWRYIAIFGSLVA